MSWERAAPVPDALAVRLRRTSTDVREPLDGKPTTISLSRPKGQCRWLPLPPFWEVEGKPQEAQGAGGRAVPPSRVVMGQRAYSL